MTAYRGKYPNNIRAVWSGKDRIIHIKTMAGEIFKCTDEHARSINHVHLPNPGTDATPYRMPLPPINVTSHGIPVAVAPTPSYRMTAIREFLSALDRSACSDDDSLAIDLLQGEIGILDGANVARACGLTV